MGRGPAARRLLGTDDTLEYVGRVCFKTGPPGRVGVESEWVVQDAADPLAPVPPARTRAALAGAGVAGPLPRGSALSFEPGGQLELSTCPAPSARLACDDLAADLGLIRPALAAAGLRLLGAGADPLRPPRRLVHTPRYDAMERHFDAGGPAGRTMMCSTAALQVCLDAGRDAADVARRWRLANALTPVLVAGFANSPVHAGRRTGWRSSRQAAWSAMDPTRTRAPAGADPVEAYGRYVLDARVMAVRRPDGPWVPSPGFTMREWASGATPYGRPTEDDLDFHLSTLFPPVRARGWLELRAVDALPEPWWRVPVAVATALLDDPAAAGAAAQVLDRLTGHWPDAAALQVAAARTALAEPALAAAASECFGAALDALPRLDAGPALAGTVRAYAERYVFRGRCPADDPPADPAHDRAEEKEPAWS